LKKILFLLFLLTSCGNIVHGAEEEKFVYTSFHAMYDFTNTIAGDAIDVRLLLPQGASAHHWEPSTRDMAALARAEAFIYHGAGMEHFVESLKASLEDELIFIEASANVEVVYNYLDPHLWLNPIYARSMKETIKEALIAIDPVNTRVFEENFNEAANNLHELALAYRGAAALFVRHDVVVSHGAFGHLSHFLGLNQVAIEGHTSDPSLFRMSEIISFMQKNGVTTIFYDKDPALAQAIAAETGAAAVMLDTFEGITADDYFTVMWRNLEALISALT